MNHGARYKQQRSNRVRLKADAAVLLDKIADARGDDNFADEIAEMLLRLHPRPGVAAPIVLTGYTKGLILAN
jgi:hypothetical protein